MTRISTGIVSAIAPTLLLGATRAAAHLQGLDPRTCAGVWTGLTTSTVRGQLHAAISVVTIADDGEVATAHDDRTFGPDDRSRGGRRGSLDGTAVAQCTFTDGVATGASYDVHYALTEDRRAIRLWIANPAIYPTVERRP